MSNVNVSEKTHKRKHHESSARRTERRARIAVATLVGKTLVAQQKRFI